MATKQFSHSRNQFWVCPQTGETYWLNPNSGELNYKVVDGEWKSLFPAISLKDYTPQPQENNMSNLDQSFQAFRTMVTTKYGKIEDGPPPILQEKTIFAVDVDSARTQALAEYLTDESIPTTSCKDPLRLDVKATNW